MDYYGVLKVPSGARQVEIDRAYQKLIRDAQYDNSINRKEIEIAYRALSDPTQRALYDATQAEKRKTSQATQKVAKKAMTSAQRDRVMRWALLVLLLAALVYFPVRFGYHFRSFSEGDTVYYKDNNQYFGKILRVESDHSFGTMRKNGYLIKMQTDAEIWFPATDIKTLCYKK